MKELCKTGERRSCRCWMPSRRWLYLERVHGVLALREPERMAGEVFGQTADQLFAVVSDEYLDKVPAIAH